MSGWQKALTFLLLAVAAAAGAGLYLLGRGAEIPAGFPLTDLAGETRELSEYAGRPLVVNFWATWCPPCRREIPLLIDLQSEFADDGLVVVGIAVEERTPVLRLAREIDFNYPVLIGEQEAVDLAVALGIDFIGLPYTVFIDADGRVREVHSGELHREEAEAALAAILP